MAKLSKDTKCLFRGILTTTETASSHEETQGFTGPPLTSRGRRASPVITDAKKPSISFYENRQSISKRAVAAYLHPDASQMAMKHFVV